MYMIECVYVCEASVAVESPRQSKCQDHWTSPGDSDRCGLEPARANRTSCMCAVDDGAGEVGLRHFPYFLLSVFSLLHCPKA